MAKLIEEIKSQDYMEDEADAKLLYALAAVFYSYGFTVEPSKLLNSKDILLNALKNISLEEALEFRRQMILSDLDCAGSA